MDLDSLDFIQSAKEEAIETILELAVILLKPQYTEPETEPKKEETA